MASNGNRGFVLDTGGVYATMEARVAQWVNRLAEVLTWSKTERLHGLIVDMVRTTGGASISAHTLADTGIGILVADSTIWETMWSVDVGNGYHVEVEVARATRLN